MRLVYLILVLLVAVIALYSNSLTGGFILDDALFLANANVTVPSLWKHFLKLEGLRPLTYFTFHLNHRWSGTNPYFYHCINLGLHLLNSLLVFACLRRIWQSCHVALATETESQAVTVFDYTALTGAAFFALHPLQTEAVNYVYQRSTLLATFFGLCGLYWLVRHPWSWKSLAVVAFFYTNAVLSKETALVWPLVYLLAGATAVASKHQATPAQGAHGRQRLMRSWQFWLAVSLLAIAAVGAWALWKIEVSGDETVAFQARYDPVTYLRAQCGVILDYMRLVILPTGQNLDHDVAVPTGWSFAAIWPPVVLAGLLALSAAAAWHGSKLGFGALACLIFLLPTSSLIPSNDLMFEHRMYLPMLGLSLVVSAFAARIHACTVHKPAWRWLLPILLGAYLVPWTWARNTLWADPVALWRDAAIKSPHKARPRVALGTLLFEKNPRAAISTLREALELEPGNRESLNNLALGHLRLGQPDEAEQAWKQAVEADPRYATAHKNLAGHYYAESRFREAAEYYEKVLQLRPNDWQSYLNLGNARWRLNELSEAERLFRQALIRNPEATHALNNLATLLQVQGRPDEAESLLKRAVAIDGNYLDARVNLVQLLLKQSRHMEARQQLQLLKTLAHQGKYRDRIEELDRKLPKH